MNASVFHPDELDLHFVNTLPESIKGIPKTSSESLFDRVNVAKQGHCYTCD
jgi:hypothetical protein